MDLTIFVLNYGLYGMVVLSILSYSILPFPTEPVIAAGLGYFTPAQVFLAVLIGSTIGSLINYYIGLKGISIFLSKKWTDKKAVALFEKWGGISLIFLSPLFMVGDALAIAAGAFRMRLWLMLLCATIGKTWYFIFIIYLSRSILGS